MSVLLGAATAIAQTNTGTPGTTRGSAAQQTESTRGTYSSDASSATSSKSGSTPAGQTDTSTGYGASATTGTSTSGRSSTTDTSTTGGATTMTGRDSAKLGWMDRRFVSKTADAGTSEVELAELAVEHASNPDVKSFAQMLVEAHSKVNAELMALAQSKGVKIDTEDLGSDRAHKRLSKKTDLEFDREFVEHMVDSHEAGVKRFEKASTDAKDADLRAFASKHVETLRQHLQKAESLRSTIMPTGRIDESSSATSRTTPSSSTDSSTSTTPASTPSTDKSTYPPSSSDTTRRNNQP